MNGSAVRRPLWLALLLPALAGCGFTRHGYESPAYAVERSDGAFEVRRYPAMTVVSTGMEGGSGGGFRRLFGYISGENAGEEKVAMTTPVFTGDGRRDEVMSFVVPAAVAGRGAPRPTGDGVALGTIEGGRFAVLRFRGRWDREGSERRGRELRQWVEAEGLSPHSRLLVANYDPPFTPPALRRNEVMVRVDDPDGIRP